MLKNVLFFRAGIEARVRGEGEGVGQVVAEARLHRHEIPLRLPSTSLNLQVNTCSWSQISTKEATFQSHLPDSTIFQTNSFDFLSEFA